MGALAVLLALSAWAAPAKKDEAVLSQDITIRGKAPEGPPVSVPPPNLDGPAIDELIESLAIYKDDHRSPTVRVKVSGAARRVSRPFPEPPYLAFDPATVSQPYNRWLFEVLGGGVVLYRTEGSGRVSSRLVWDGKDLTGAMAAKVGSAFFFRFTGIKGGDEFTLTSEPVELKSLAYREALGSTRMEAANSELFVKDSSKLKDEAPELLNRMAARMGGTGPKPYRIALHQAKPSSKLAGNRASAIRTYLSTYFVVHPSKIQVDVEPIGARGDVTACESPAERGGTIRTR